MELFLYSKKNKMNKKPLISVILPVYNEEKYLDKCLASLASQSYKNTEIIVIDDGSTDKSLKIIDKFKVIVVKQTHQGAGAARNNGIKKAKGEIVVLADADMYYDKNYLEKIVDPIIKGKALGTFTKKEYVANPDNVWSICWSVNSGLPRDRRLPKNYKDIENAFRALKKECFLKAGGYDESEGYVDDSSISRSIGVLAVNAPGAVSFHFNPASLSEVYSSSRWIGRSVIFKPSLVNLLRYSPFNSLRVSVKYLFKGAPFRIIPFKLAFDLGMASGIFLKKGKTAK